MGVSRRLALILVVGVLLCDRCIPAANDNAHGFKVLCSLIRLTEADVNLPNNVALPSGLEDDLIKLNMTTAEEAWYDLFSGKDEDNWGEAKNKDPFKEWATKDRTIEQMYPKWQKAKKELLDDAAKGGANKFLRHPASYQRLVAHARIRQLAARYQELRDGHGREEGNLKSLADEISKNFRKALTASDAEKATVAAGSFGDNRGGSQYACGHTTGATSAAGKSLANDLACLCTSTSTYGNGLCVDTLTADARSKTWNADTGGLTAFQAVYPHCPAAQNGFKPTAHGLQRLLANFTALLGIGGQATSTIKSEPYQIGGTSGTTAHTCTGGSADAICISYHVNFRPGSGKPAGIPWLNELEAALEKLEKLEAEEAKMHALNARAESLRDAAWVAYEEANLPDPTGATGDALKAAKTEKANATTVTGTTGTATPLGDGRAIGNVAHIPHFILPLSLLI